MAPKPEQEAASLKDDELVVYELQLEDDGSPSKERSYIRLPAPIKPYVLRISIDAGASASKAGILYTNLPLDGSDFDRAKFHKKTLPQDFSSPIHIDIPINKAGVFQFYIEHDASALLPLSSLPDSVESSRATSRICFINVDPVLTTAVRTPILDPKTNEVLPVGKGGMVTEKRGPLPIDGLVVQSMFSKWMGTLEEWTPHLDVTRDRGYNMVHFPPLQQRGDSGSPYSIYDQLLFDDALFKDPAKLSREERQVKVKQMLKRMKDEWGLLAMIDVVYNHTANNTAWLQEHPEAGYNMVNSPHLEAAVELDTGLLKLSASLPELGLPTVLESQADLDRIMDAIKNKCLVEAKIWEFYVVDVSTSKEQFSEAWASGEKPTTTPKLEKSELQANAKGMTKQEDLPALESTVDICKLSQKELAEEFARLCLPKDWNRLSSRFHAKVHTPSAVAFVAKVIGKTPGNKSKDEATASFAKLLDEVNLGRYKEYDDDVEVILENLRNRIKYTRLESNGPKLGEINEKNPLIETYFTRLPKNEKTAKHDPKALALANNGWTWDTTMEFASAHSRAYLRRDVIIWTDCVKLRYGLAPEDNPWLWDWMTKYTKLLASTFDAFRIDNCHSTPVHLGEKMLDVARKLNPNLYVEAELFTGSQDMDVHYVSRLGLNSLTREVMHANDPEDESSTLYKYGLGKPLGSMDSDCLTEKATIQIAGKTRPCSLIPLTGSKPHAFLMDCTHDNPSPASKRTAEDALPTGALVTFAWSAIGSNKGFDDLYAKLLDLVKDTRKYDVYDGPSSNGIGEVKRILNHLHTEMASAGFSEGHFHQEGDYIIAHRVHPQTHRGYLLIAHTAFSPRGKQRGNISPPKFFGTKAKFITGGYLEVSAGEDPSDEKTLKGLPGKYVQIKRVQVEEKSSDEGQYTEITVPDEFPPGSVALFSTWMEGQDEKLDQFVLQGAKEAFSKTDFVDLNILLFRADGEERDATGGSVGVYDVPGMGPLAYCGFEGWMHPLRYIMRTNDLGHPLCRHLREGPWALNYVHDRLEKQVDKHPGLAAPAKWLKDRFDIVRERVPPFMRPRFFAMVINTAYKAARDQAIGHLSEFVKSGHSFTQALALTSYQMYGQVNSASLHPKENTPSLAAGLPHFSAGWARCWGRDIFISIGGLLLTTGMWDVARLHILAGCSALRHGMIPNLIDSLRTPRYNSRDSPWWMLQNIQDYVSRAPEGLQVLNAEVPRRFPKNGDFVAWDDPRAYSYTSTVAEVIQEILQNHASGIHFREHNAGPNLDSQMKDPGFNLDVETDWKTGLIFGGNEFNCGTWQDKNGESEKAGNKGCPGTPRDGAAVEITGLLKSALRWVNDLSSKGKFPFKGVDAEIQGKKRQVTYKEWNDLIQSSFEKCYYIPEDSSEDAKYTVDAKLVRRRGIYKDVFGSGKGRERSDYQLRSNFPVAMTVAPELFNEQHALGALKVAHNVLLGPLGMKTLDPEDPEYRGNYDNSNDSHDRAVAKGWNYHQGPEWGWPTGYFLRAYLLFDSRAGAGKKDINETLHHIHRLLSDRRKYIRDTPWAGLPELTNESGQYCKDSCETQAWSSSTILEALYDVYRLDK